MPYKDPEKMRKYRREWAKRNHRIKSDLPYHQSKKNLIHQAKDKPCAICGQKFPTIAMDLHHIDPCQKEFTISKALREVGYDRLVREIDKCVTLCAICHRLLHAGLAELETLG